MTYFVYADYGYTSERVIHSGSDYDKAHRVFLSETFDATDMDCEMMIELSSFAETGEYVVHERQDVEDGWDDDASDLPGQMDMLAA